MQFSGAVIRIYKISKLWKWLAKKLHKKTIFLICHLKMDFYRWKNIFFIDNKLYSDRSELDLSDATIRIQYFHFSRKLSRKNWWNYYVAKKRIVSKLSKILHPNFYNTNWRLESSLCQNVSFLFLIVSEKWDVKERDGRAGSGFSLLLFFCFGKKNFNVQ